MTDNSKKRLSMAPCAPVRAMLVVSGRLAIAGQLSDLVMTSMTGVCAPRAGETAPARRPGNARSAGHDGTLNRPRTHRHTEPLRASQEKRKTPTKGGQFTTTAYASVQDLRRIGVAAGKAKTWTRVPLRTTPWALR
jgi:hypothetical protein